MHDGRHYVDRAMRFTAGAVLVGVALGLLFGGRVANLAGVRVRWWWALPVGAGSQVLPELVDVPGAAGLVLGGSALLVVFAVANLRLVGMPVALVGLALNTIVIGVNGGMPVRAEAIVATGRVEAVDLAELDLGAERHLERADDRLVLLADILPVPVSGEVLSFGDLILGLGLADVAFRLVRPFRRKSPERPQVSPRDADRRRLDPNLETTEIEG